MKDTSILLAPDARSKVGTQRIKRYTWMCEMRRGLLFIYSIFASLPHIYEKEYFLLVFFYRKKQTMTRKNEESNKRIIHIEYSISNKRLNRRKQTLRFSLEKSVKSIEFFEEI